MSIFYIKILHSNGNESYVGKAKRLKFFVADNHKLTQKYSVRFFDSCLQWNSRSRAQAHLNKIRKTYIDQLGSTCSLEVQELELWKSK